MHVVHRTDGAIVERDDQIPFAQPGERSRAAGDDRRDFDGMSLRQRVAPRDQAVDRSRLSDDAEIRATNVAVREQLTHHALRGVDRDGEADALGHRNDGRIDPDDSRPRVHQGPARIAGIQRDVRLDDVLDQPSSGSSQRSTDGADHAGRHVD